MVKQLSDLRRSNKSCKRLKTTVNRKPKRLKRHGVSGHVSEHYIFYSVLNTDVKMDQGTAAAMIAGSLIHLHTELDTDSAKLRYIDSWIQNGEQIVILKGYDHKHLKHLQEEVKFVALGVHAARQNWGRGRVIIVLSVFGKKDDLVDIFEELSYLK